MLHGKFRIGQRECKMLHSKVVTKDFQINAKEKRLAIEYAMKIPFEVNFFNLKRIRRRDTFHQAPRRIRHPRIGTFDAINSPLS